jgi:hypothetical protein
MTSARDQLRVALLNSDSWLHKLQQGDKVAYLTGDHWTTNAKVTKVLRFTTTQVITEDGLRWYRADGREVIKTGVYRRSVLMPPDCPKVLRVIIDMTGRSMKSQMETILHTHGRAKPEERESWSSLAEGLEEAIRSCRTRLLRLESDLVEAATKYAGKEVDRSWR